MFLKNQKGFSLAEVMVAAGLLGVITLAVNQLIQNQTKSVTTIEKQFEVTSIMGTLRTVLSDRAACHNTFGINPGPPPTGTHNPNNIPIGTITEIKNSNNNVIFQSNTDPSLAPQIGNGKVRILSFRVTTDNLAPIGPDSNGVTELIIRFHRGSNIYGTETIEKKIQLNARTDSSTTMIDCGTTAINDVVVNVSAMCDALGGIYDSTGRGGVGDCHTLQPNNQTTNNGDLVIQGTSTLNGDTAINGNTIVNGTTALNGNVSIVGNVTVADTYWLEMLSDRRLKYDIFPLESTLDKISLINPVKFKWRKNSQEEIGFIAQNVEHVYPDLVSTTERGLLAVKYPNVVAIAISGIKEQQEQIRALEANLEDMKNENKKLSQEIASIKKLLLRRNKNIKVNPPYLLEVEQ